VVVRAALILLVLTACGDDAPGRDDPTATNGSRLLAERWVGPDGAASFARWYDRELEMYCAFAMASDGRVRCLPTEARVGGFVDAGCTQPAVMAPSACTDVRFAISSGDVIRVDGPPLSSAYVKGGDFPCQKSTDENRVFFAPGAPVPPASFVAADVTTTGTALVTTEYLGEDGSRQIVALDGGPRQAVSSAVGLGCGIRLTGPRTAECTFERSAGGAHTHYSDDACTMPVIEPQGFGSQITIDYKARPCAPTPLYQLGEFLSVPNVFYRDASGACVPLQIIGTMVFDIAPIANANIALSLEIDDTHETRLRHTTWVTSAGERWPGPLFDVELDTPCVARADDIGHARCVPALNEGFRDALDVSTSTTCTMRANLSASCWGQSVRPRTLPRSACGYGLVELEQASGTLVSGPLYTGEFVGECGPMDPTGLELRDGPYAVVDAAAFAEMTLERDR